MPLPDWADALEDDGVEVRRLKLPASEVIMHMRMVDQVVWAAEINDRMVQLYDDDGREISFPIGKGEAGWYIQLEGQT